VSDLLRVSSPSKLKAAPSRRKLPTARDLSSQMSALEAEVLRRM
jgi:hypothetical protein